MMGNVTKPSRATVHAASICVNGRASHSVTQMAATCTAPVGGVMCNRCNRVK